VDLNRILDAAQLPDPVRVVPAPDGEWSDPPLVLITAGEHVLVGIAVYPDRVLVGPGRIRWDGPAHPVATLRDPVEVPLGTDIDPSTAAAIRQAVTVAIIRRRRGFRRCRYCGWQGPVEHMNVEAGLCDSCASEHLRVVFS
jgi:hypothetical protein